jgi:hypothetical protein
MTEEDQAVVVWSALDEMSCGKAVARFTKNQNEEVIDYIYDCLLFLFL